MTKLTSTLLYIWIRFYLYLHANTFQCSTLALSPLPPTLCYNQSMISGGNYHAQLELRKTYQALSGSLILFAYRQHNEEGNESVNSLFETCFICTPKFTKLNLTLSRSLIQINQYRLLAYLWCSTTNLTVLWALMITLFSLWRVGEFQVGAIPYKKFHFWVLIWGLSFIIVRQVTLVIWRTERMFTSSNLFSNVWKEFYTTNLQ